MTKNRFQGQYGLGLINLLIPDINIFQSLYLSFYPKITQQDLINSSKPAEKQKNQWPLKIKTNSRYEISRNFISQY